MSIDIDITSDLGKNLYKSIWKGRQSMKKILVLTDTQNDFISGVLGNQECQTAVPVISKIIADGEYDMVFATRDTHGSGYLDTQEGRKLPVIHTVEDTKGWEIHDDIMASLSEKFKERLNDKLTIVNKGQFGSIALAERIADCLKKFPGEEAEIHFTGFCTGICVISNVMIVKAKLPEAKICVIEKACACVTPETHKTAIEAMKTCQVDIL